MEREKHISCPALIIAHPPPRCPFRSQAADEPPEPALPAHSLRSFPGIPLPERRSPIPGAWPTPGFRSRSYRYDFADDLTGRRPYAPQRATRTATGLGPLPRSAGYPSSLIPLRARLSPSAYLLPPQKSQSWRPGSPAPGEGAEHRRVRLCDKARPPSRDASSAESPTERSRGQAGRRGGGDVPPPLRREVISRLGSLLWMLGSSEAGSPETRSASGAPLAGLAA
ncbi:unnamed protein product, partial [Coccothraustes coccothraustes]